MNTTIDDWIMQQTTCCAPSRAVRRHVGPARPAGCPATPLTAEAQRVSGALMRVNHVGEVCAQALYEAQALGSRPSATICGRPPRTRSITWPGPPTPGRLGAHRSWLNPLWYAGAFALGSLAARAGDRWSLGFVIETERQVEAHLAEHLSACRKKTRLAGHRGPDEGRRSPARRGRPEAGGHELPWPVRQAMRRQPRS
jgi:ubiquinone biosynthesis monooxygenase Coq7